MTESAEVREERVTLVSPQRLQLTMPATPTCQARARHRLERWLLEGNVSKRIIADVVLGTAEALTNAVRHAYREHAVPGPMSLAACRDASVVVVTVQDEGTWKPPRPETIGDGDQAVQIGGWGLPMLRALSQSLTIGHPALRPGTIITARYPLTPVPLG